MQGFNSPGSDEDRVASGARSHWDTNNEETFALPTWIFDIEDDDENLDVYTHSSLLQELEIDPMHIIECVVWQFKCPFFGLLRRASIPSLDGCRFVPIRFVHSLCGRVVDYNSHPIKLTSKYKNERATTASSSGYTEADTDDAAVSNNDNSVDFWGPMTIVTLFAGLLWLGNQKNVPYVYVVWVLGALLLHLTVRPFLDGSSMSFHMAMLGYSLCPQLPLCFIVLAFRPSVFVCTVLQMLGVVWSATAALMGYQMIIRPLIASTEERSKLLLLLPMVFLFQIYMITLVPMRKWQINGGQPVSFL